jgi:hypothetical protein
MQIKIDVTDWQKEYDEIEADVSTTDKLTELSVKHNTAQLARLAIIAREKKLAPNDILPANKPLFLSGAMAALTQLIVRQRETFTLKNGKGVTVREFVGPLGGEHDQVASDTHVTSVTSPPEMFVKIESDEALGRSIDYLLKRVPGYIYGSLTRIAVGGGDVRKLADELIAKIEEMVKELE